MGLSWQQGPLAPGAVGRFLVPGPLPDRMLFAEPLRRRMRVRFGGAWIADSEDVMLLHEPGRYPVAYFPLAAVADGVLELVPSDPGVQARSVAEVDMPDEPELLQRVEIAVRRREVDEGAARDLLCGAGRGIGVQHVQHGAPRTGQAHAVGTQQLERVGEAIDGDTAPLARHGHARRSQRSGRPVRIRR